MKVERNGAKVLFLGKKDDDCCQEALSFCQGQFDDVTGHLGVWGEGLPAGIESWEGDYIISYLSRWIVPERILGKAKIAAINFHPASPNYPGIGCNNFALYDGAAEYGATCHHMSASVDTGSIIDVKRFPVYPADTVATLLARTYAFQLVLFYEIMARIMEGRELPQSEERWTGKAFTRAELNALGELTSGMSQEEMARRIRATSYGTWQPTIELDGLTFGYQP